MRREAAFPLRAVKYGAIALSGLMVTGIVTLMVLARGTGEDITGIVSPAGLIAIVSGVVAIVAFVVERRDQREGNAESEIDRTG